MVARESAEPASEGGGLAAVDLALGWVKAWIAAVLALAALAVAATFLSRPSAITDYFFYRQDLPATGLCFVLFAGLLAFAGSTRLPAWAEIEIRARWVYAAAVMVVPVCWAGARFVQHDYGLSADEFLAQFDAKILASGRLAAPLPPEWRGFTAALQPAYMGPAGDAHWVSFYLPVNAAFLALGSALGSQSLVQALWAGVAVAAAFGAARRLWPERPEAAPVAALLVATSPQVLITAMTPFAMPMHLAANLVWLWLILHDRRLSHALAVLAAFLACGIHQIVFFPLFAAPFVLEMWLSRRWRTAVLHTTALALILAFWNVYPALRLQLLEPVAAGISGARAESAIDTAFRMLARFDLDAVGLMAKNLFRFVSWQNVVTIPLMLLAAPAAWRAGGNERALLLGLLFTGLSMFLLSPFQGHGWGYRYFHGLIGSAALLAAWGWSRTIEGLEAPARRRAHTVTAAAVLLSVLVLLPFRAWQAHAFVHPYAEAAARLLRSDAEVLIIDDTGMWYGAVLLRNDPFFAPPVMLYLPNLSAEQLRRVCGRRQVGLYGGERIGSVNPLDPRPTPHVKELRRQMADAGCGKP